MNKKILSIIIGTIIIGSIITVLLIGTNKSSYELVLVKKGNIVQEVSASGKVESSTKIDLHFKNSGKLVKMNLKVGEKVFAGQLLAKQDTTQLDAQVLEMQAGIDLQKARLQQLQAGASPEDININNTLVLNAEAALEDAKINLIDKINDVYIKGDDAVRVKGDQFFDNPRGYNPQLNIHSFDSQLENDVESERFLIESIMNKCLETLSSISTKSDLEFIMTLADKNIDKIKSFFNKLALIVNALSVNDNISQVTLDKWKADITAARTNISTATSNFSLAKENLKAKEAGLKMAEDQLALKKAPARSSDIAVYQAQINQAEASLQKILAQREELIIYTPLSGVVTDINGEVGETVNPEMIIVSLTAGDVFQIKLNVIEDNIVNVRVGQKTRITFEAINGEEFTGRVMSIDPGETIIGGAVYYQTTIIFDKTDERIKSGMTANVWIKISISENTLFIPISAIKDQGDKKIVRILDGGQIIDREVTIGIKNDIGMVEIVSGLSEGEQVVLGNKK